MGIDARAGGLAFLAAVAACAWASGCRGWSMRLGSDKQTALGAAICDVVAELGDARTHGLATEIEALCDRTEYRLSQESALEWNEIAKTIVDFEELD